MRTKQKKNTLKSDKIGRPPIVVQWPDGEFTVAQLVQKTGFSRVTLYSKIAEALASNTIAEFGKITGKGRPSLVYKRLATPPPSPPPVPVQPVVPPVAV
jgi:hypothetical protein